MSELILVDKQSGLEVGRRSMLASERYQLYEDHREHELLLFQGRFYVTHGVAWRLPEENFMASVTFHSNEMQYCDD